MSANTFRKAARTSGTRPVVRVALCASAGIIFMLLLLWLTAYIALQMDLSDTVQRICAYGCCVLPAFVCSVFCAATARSHRVPSGLLAACPLLFLLLILCLVYYQRIGTGFLFATLAVLAAALLGSFAAVHKKHKRRKYR